MLQEYPLIYNCYAILNSLAFYYSISIWKQYKPREANDLLGWTSQADSENTLSNT